MPSDVAKWVMELYDPIGRKIISAIEKIMLSKFRDQITQIPPCCVHARDRNRDFGQKLMCAAYEHNRKEQHRVAKTPGLLSVN